MKVTIVGEGREITLEDGFTLEELVEQGIVPSDYRVFDSNGNEVASDEEVTGDLVAAPVTKNA